MNVNACSNMGGSAHIQTQGASSYGNACSSQQCAQNCLSACQQNSSFGGCSPTSSGVASDNGGSDEEMELMLKKILQNMGGSRSPAQQAAA
jgi:hypothetical protein